MEFTTVNDILNRAAVELGFDPSVDALASTNSAFVQLHYLLDSAGQELVGMYDWQALKTQYSASTASSFSGAYTMPVTFDHVVHGTVWDTTNLLPILGPITSQEYRVLTGSGITTGTGGNLVYLINGNVFQVYPNSPVPTGTITFDYISNGWVDEASHSAQYNTVQSSGNLVRFEPRLIISFLKLKFLEAKGFDSSAAKETFADCFDTATGRDKGARILNAGGAYTSFKYLGLDNIPITGLG